MFLVLALAVMGPLLLPGHIFALDSPLALNWDTSGYFWGTSDGTESVFAATYNSAPVAFVLKALGFILPSWVVEKLWLVLLLWLCGIGAYRLPYLRGKGRYYAGLLYTVNPFTYVRFVTGQWGLLGAYALIPFVVTAFVRMLEEPRPRHAVKTALLLTLVGFLQVHGLALALLVIVALYLSKVVVARQAFRSSLSTVLLSAALFLGINAFWIARYVIAGVGVAHNMPIGELSYFTASPPLDVLSLRGFWLSEAYVDIADLIPVWWLLFIPLLYLAVHGALSLVENHRLRWLSLGLAIVAVVSLFLAAGPGSRATEGVFRALWGHFPVYRAFRDSHKFVALLALAYAYLGGFGVQSLVDRRPQLARWARLLPRFSGVVLLIVPVLYAIPMFGAWGQVRPTRFPAEWHEVRSMLDEDRGDYNVLFLPWHMYQAIRRNQFSNV